MTITFQKFREVVSWKGCYPFGALRVHWHLESHPRRGAAHRDIQLLRTDFWSCIAPDIDL